MTEIQFGWRKLPDTENGPSVASLDQGTLMHFPFSTSLETPNEFESDLSGVRATNLCRMVHPFSVRVFVVHSKIAKYVPSQTFLER